MHLGLFIQGNHYLCNVFEYPHNTRIRCAENMKFSLVNCTEHVYTPFFQQCIVQKYATDTMEVRYSLGCETTQVR